MKKRLFFHSLFLALLAFSSGVSAQTPAPFTCQEGVGILFGAADANSPTRGRVINLATGTAISVSGNLIPANQNLNKINAIGYNVNDNFVYGWKQGSTQAVRVGSNWVVQNVTTNLGTAQTFNVGDVDSYGLMWLYTQSDTGPQSVLRLNLNNTPATGAWFNISATNIADWAVSPINGNLYAVERLVEGGVGSFRLLEFVYSTTPSVTFTRNIKGTITGVRASDLSSGFGAAYMDKDGTLFVQHNTSGNIYRINNPHGNGLAATFVSTGVQTTTNDGARCFNAPAQSPPPPAFNCADGKSYLFQDSPTVAKEYNLATGTATPVNGGDPLIPGTVSRDINAIGYNPVDNYIWGYRGGTNQIVRVGADWSVDYYHVLGLPDDASLNVGDVSKTGIYYAKSGAAGNAGHYKIDLNPGSPDYLTAVLIPVSYSQMADWSISPIDGNIYTIRNVDRHLIKIDPETGASVSLGAITGMTKLPAGNALVGATFMDSDGNLYLSNNNPGYIYKIATPHTITAGGNVPAQEISSGPASGQNDGARCALAPIAGLSQPAFNCADGKSYLFQSEPTVAVEYDLATGTATVVNSGNPLIPAGVGERRINGIGYNPVDNYIWGSRVSTNQLARVGSDWSVDFLTVTGLSPSHEIGNVGDVSNSGIFYVKAGNKESHYRIDLNPGSADYLKAVLINSPGSTTLADWSISPKDNMLYGIRLGDRALLRINPETGAVTNLGTVTGLTQLPAGSIEVGATFMDADGNFYISNNNPGHIYRIATPHTLTAGGNIAAQHISGSPVSAANDGARCANSPIPGLDVQPPFVCADGGRYLFQDNPTIAYRYDLATGTATAMNGGNPLIPSGANRQINATGYNQVDNYIWGAVVGTSQIARIGSDWSVQTFNVTGLPTTAGMNVGDVSADGIYYVRSGGENSFYKIDLNPGSANYLVAVEVTNSQGGMADWAFSPIDGKLYAVDNGNRKLLRIDPATGAVTDLGTISGLGGINLLVGAVFMDIEGGFYISNNNPGRIYKIAIPNTGNTAAQFLSAGPTSGLNDGAACWGPPVYIQPPFTCEAGMSYLFNADAGQATRAYEYNLNTGTMTGGVAPLIPGPTNNLINAIGYNVLDNYIWGHRNNTNQIVRVGNDWSVTFYEVTGLPGNANYNVGDVDASGNLYLYTQGGTSIYKINLTNLPDLSATELSTSETNIADWAVSPINGKIYAVERLGEGGGSFRLVEFDPVTGARTVKGAVTGAEAVAGSGGFGAVFMDSNGALYLSHNSTGNVYRIDNPHGSGLAATFVVKGDPSATNDGARCFNAALPVTLVHFNVTRENTTVNLTWSTSSEVNSRQFDVEHSPDGRTWANIGTVLAKGKGAGLIRYDYVHGNPAAGINFYRLRMIDLDGTSELSIIRSVSFSETGTVSVPLPNPVAGNRVWVSNHAGVKSVTLYNMLGKEVIKTGKVSDEGIDVSTLPAGLYIMNIVRDNNIRTMHKVVVEK